MTADKIRALIAEARKQSEHLRKLELSGAELLDRLADALEASLTAPGGDARETSALRRVWKAMGCAPNPDDFRQTVRDAMWDQVVADCEAHAANDTRVYRENQSLLAELLELKARDIAGEIEEPDGIEADLKALYPWTGRSIPNMRVQEERLAFKAGLRRAAEIVRDGR